MDIIENWVWPHIDRTGSDSLTLLELDSLPEDMMGYHASIDSICWKCKQACIYESVYESDLLDLQPFKKSWNTFGRMKNHIVKYDSYNNESMWSPNYYFDLIQYILL